MVCTRNQWPPLPFRPHWQVAAEESRDQKADDLLVGDGPAIGVRGVPTEKHGEARLPKNHPGGGGAGSMAGWTFINVNDVLRESRKRGIHSGITRHSNERKHANETGLKGDVRAVPALGHQSLQYPAMVRTTIRTLYCIHHG